MSQVKVTFKSGLPQEKLDAIVSQIIEMGTHLLYEDHKAFAEVLEEYDVGITDEDLATDELFIETIGGGQ